MRSAEHVFMNFHGHEKLKITQEVEEIRNCMLVENTVREWFGRD
jgi:hypothetical protein